MLEEEITIEEFKKRIEKLKKENWKVRSLLKNQNFSDLPEHLKKSGYDLMNIKAIKDDETGIIKIYDNNTRENVKI